MKMALLYVWTICISLSAAYNVVGDFGVILFILIFAVVLNRFTVNRKTACAVLAFGMFIAIKAVGIKGTQSISDYHSVYNMLSENAKRTSLFLLLPIMKKVSSENRRKADRAFLLFYHISVVLSIFVLNSVGRNTYRLSLSRDYILLAPQFYIMISVIMSMSLVYKIIKGREHRFMYVLLLLINITYIYMANYTTQMVFLILGCACSLIFCSDIRKRNSFINLSMLLVAVALAFPYLADIVIMIKDGFFADNPVVSVRLDEIALFLRRGNLMGTDLLVRVDRISLSLDTFKSNILTGVPFSMYNTTTTGVVVGGHSEWPDDLARYGLLGGILFAAFMYFGIMGAIPLKDKRIQDFRKPLILVLFLYGFANPFFRSGELLILYLIVDELILWKSTEDMDQLPEMRNVQ